MLSDLVCLSPNPEQEPGAINHWAFSRTWIGDLDLEEEGQTVLSAQAFLWVEGVVDHLSFSDRNFIREPTRTQPLGVVRWGLCASCA